MCLIFHTWEKWSKVQSYQYKAELEFVAKTVTIEELYQTRECIMCGKYQKRLIEKRIWSK